MTNTWFTSDTHFLHDRICEYDKRPFADLHEMTEAIIDGWNSRVHKGDVVYHLGDFAMSRGKRSWAEIDRILARLNGTKFLIKGNHDRDEVTRNARWTKVSHYHEMKYPLARYGGTGNRKIVMCHYALRSWNQMHRGSFMLHGHSHGSLKDIGGKIMDVGTNIHAYRPVSLDFVVEYMAGRTMELCDHHGG